MPGWVSELTTRIDHPPPRGQGMGNHANYPTAMTRWRLTVTLARGRSGRWQTEGVEQKAITARTGARIRGRTCRRNRECAPSRAINALQSAAGHATSRSPTIRTAAWPAINR
jgi:hypothetical protein